MVENATVALAARGYIADRIHGDITQANRERVVKRFKKKVPSNYLSRPTWPHVALT